MKTIDSLDLALVHGGTGHPTSSIGPLHLDSGSSSNNDQMLATLQGIQSSLNDLGKNQNQNNGLFGGSNGLLFMTMALAMSRRNDVVVYGGGGGCRRPGFSFRAWW